MLPRRLLPHAAARWSGGGARVGALRGMLITPTHSPVMRARQTRTLMTEPAAKKVKTMDGAKAATAPRVTPEVLGKLSLLQSGLNALINTNWQAERKPDDWALAVTLECAELIDSYPWKWWKNVKGKVDINNVKIELVDILHFSLSGQMMVGGEDIADSKITTPLMDTQNAIKTFRQMIALTNTHDFMTITRQVVEAADDLDFNIVSYYIAKHTLNYIRQLGGYKDGTYVKVNKGVEDNELLHQCIAGVTLEDITRDFEAVSNTIMGKVYDAFQIGPEARKTVASWTA